MPMEQNLEYELENSRTDKIKALGFLCYNLFVDGTAVFPEMIKPVEEIGASLVNLTVQRNGGASLGQIAAMEEELEGKITSLGCLCYNLYIDSKLFPNDVLTLCDTISEINREIKMAKSPAIEYFKPPVGTSEGAAERKESYPYGMEPIPLEYKQCMCGYRNRAEAKYCARCGAKLHA